MLSLLWVIVCVLLGVLLGWFGRPYVTGEAARLRSAEQTFRDAYSVKKAP